MADGNHLRPVDRFLRRAGRAARRHGGAPGAALGRRAMRLHSKWMGWRHRRDFNDVRRFCLFVGRARSGTTLIGSLLDAHPNACIATELGALNYVQSGWSRPQLFALLRRNAAVAAQRGNEWTGYSYQVPGQWQGRYARLRVIGDKQAAGTLRALVVGDRHAPLDSRPPASSPDLLDRLRALVGVPLRFVHVIRNPFDQMASAFHRLPDVTLEELARRNFLWVEMLKELRERLSPDELLDVYHEDVIADPRRELTRLCRFLDLEASDSYLDACAAVVSPAPHRQRESVEWPPGVVDSFEQRLREYPYLAHYSFRDSVASSSPRQHASNCPARLSAFRPRSSLGSSPRARLSRERWPHGNKRGAFKRTGGSAWESNPPLGTFATRRPF